MDTISSTPPALTSFPRDSGAVVIGASGGIGGAFLAALEASDTFAHVAGFARSTAPSLDITDEVSIAAVAAALKNSDAQPRLIIDATGFLHGDGVMPEKSWRQLEADRLAQNFAVNAIGPALLMKHVLPLLPRAGKAVFATLSAKVGSIGDNQLGGWYGYRAAKAALNQFVHTAAIELAQRRPEAICVALHPGTVETRLTDPFAKTGLTVRPPADAARLMLDTLDRLTPADSGGFFNYAGERLPW